MAMHNPPHPGAFIQEVYLASNEMSGRELALKLGVAASTLNRVLNEASEKWLFVSQKHWDAHPKAG
jgi:plasmid maintenance system antidote protein VapI